MDILFNIGLLLIIGYIVGWIFNKIGLPKIIGYIITGIILSPNTIDFINPELIKSTNPILDICLAFIAFEIGGELKWSKIKKHEKEIVSITLLASIFPFILIVIGFLTLWIVFPSLSSYNFPNILLLALLLGSLASPTAPAATLAIIHQYKAKGKVTDTILGVVALDDALGILLFSIIISISSLITGTQTGFLGNVIFNSIYHILVAVVLGMAVATIMNYTAKFLKIQNEGQWIVVILSLLSGYKSNNVN